MAYRQRYGLERRTCGVARVARRPRYVTHGRRYVIVTCGRWWYFARELYVVSCRPVVRPLCEKRVSNCYRTKFRELSVV